MFLASLFHFVGKRKHSFVCIRPIINFTAVVALTKMGIVAAGGKWPPFIPTYTYIDLRFSEEKSLGSDDFLFSLPPRGRVPSLVSCQDLQRVCPLAYNRFNRIYDRSKRH